MQRRSRHCEATTDPEPRKSYSEMARLRTFEERFEYLKLDGKVGEETFGASRGVNQSFYRSPKWRDARRLVIIRDDGCDLGVPGHQIPRYICVHHINPVTQDQIRRDDPALYDPENLVSVGSMTHKGLHYGDIAIADPSTELVERKPNDTCPWKE